MNPPDILDVFILAGVALIAHGGEKLVPGAGFIGAGAALWLAGMCSPISRELADPPASGRGPETR